MVQINDNILASFKEINDEKADKQSNLMASDKPYIDAVMTAYGPDCVGCSGITAYGYSVWDTNTYFDDTYQEVFIVAADKSIPFGSIIEFIIDEKTIYAIVLDRGGLIGNNNRSQFDLLMKSEALSSDFGVKKIKYRIIRTGF